MNTLIFDNRGQLDAALALRIAERLREDLQAHGRASLAVSGGSTPKGLFAQLAAADLDWSQVAITLVDERWVPDDHADSNARLVREHLLVSRAAAARFVPLYSDHPNPLK